MQYKKFYPSRALRSARNKETYGDRLKFQIGFEKMTFEQKLETSEEIQHVDI